MEDMNRDLEDGAVPLRDARVSEGSIPIYLSTHLAPVVDLVADRNQEKPLLRRRIPHRQEVRLLSDLLHRTAHVIHRHLALFLRPHARTENGNVLCSGMGVARCRGSGWAGGRSCFLTIFRGERRRVRVSRAGGVPRTTCNSDQREKGPRASR